MKKSEDLVAEIVNLNESDALSIVQARLASGEEPLRILSDTRDALQMVGNKFEAGIYFIPELIFSGEIMKEINSLVKPYLTQDTTSQLIGKVVLGTVEGDIHDIGKDMVAFMLEINGFEVFDLGVNVSTNQFVSRTLESGSKIVGLSVFLTNCIESMKSTIQALRQEVQGEELKIMIGGNFVSELVCNSVGADGWGKEASMAVKLARQWAGQVD